MPYVGRMLLRFEKVTSTMDVAKNLVNKFFPEGTVVIANVQTKGRGRRNRSWCSPRGGLWCSIILGEKALYGIQPQCLLLIAALSIVETLKKYGVTANVKWPNDVYVNDKKIAGILAETIITKNKIKNMILGIGVNLNNELTCKEAKGKSISLSQLTGKKVNIENFLKEMLEKINTNLEKAKKETFSIINEINSVFYLKNKKIRITQNKKTIEGRCKGITSQCELIIETEKGTKNVETPTTVEIIE